MSELDDDSIKHIRTLLFQMESASRDIARRIGGEDPVPTGQEKAILELQEENRALKEREVVLLAQLTEGQKAVNLFWATKGDEDMREEGAREAMTDFMVMKISDSSALDALLADARERCAKVAVRKSCSWSEYEDKQSQEYRRGVEEGACAIARIIRGAAS